MRYRALNEYLKERFGCKVYKLALDGGMTCPNRDGTLGTRGCIFCSRRGSGDFAVSAELDIAAQLDAARVIVAGKVYCLFSKLYKYLCTGGQAGTSLSSGHVTG